MTKRWKSKLERHIKCKHCCTYKNWQAKSLKKGLSVPHNIFWWKKVIQTISHFPYTVHFIGAAEGLACFQWRFWARSTEDCSPEGSPMLTRPTLRLESQLYTHVNVHSFHEDTHQARFLMTLLGDKRVTPFSRALIPSSACLLHTDIIYTSLHLEVVSIIG